MSPPERSARPWAVAAAVFSAAVAVYVATLYPSVPGGDAGELIAVANRAEVAHPPGYPLYTLLAKLATLLPVGTVAWRVNLLSAVCGAGAAALIAATVTMATGSAPAAVAAAGLFAFSPVVWTHAIGAEVFALHNLIVAALAFLTLAWRQSGDPRLAIATFAAIGLGLAHHHTVVFYALPIAAWMLWHGRPDLTKPRRLAVLGLATAVGLGWYLHLPIAARGATTLSWGDPSTLRGFLDHLLRRDYGTFQLGQDGLGPAPYVAQLAAWGAHTVRGTLVVGALAALAGATIARRSGAGALRDWVALLVACLVVYVLGFHALANLPVGDPLYREVTARFWQQSDVVVFLLLGVGGAVLGARVARGIALTLALALVAAQLALGWGDHDRRRDDTVARFGRAILAPLPADAILLTRGDLATNATRYLQSVEGVRPDVALLDQELMTKRWYLARAVREHPTVRFPGAVYDPADPAGFTMRAFLDANTRPVFAYPEWKHGDPSVVGAYELWPIGLASRAIAVGAAPRLDEWRRASVAAVAALDADGWPPLTAYRTGTWEHVAREDVWLARHRLGWWLLTKALEPDGDRDLLDAARLALEEAAAAHPEPPWFVARNLGIVYERLALREPAWRSEQLAAWERYLDRAPPDDDGRAAIAATVARLRATARSER